MIPGQIIYADITVETLPKPRVKAKTLTARLVIGIPFTGYTDRLNWSEREDRLLIQRLGFAEDLIITNLEVISTHGFMNKR